MIKEINNIPENDIFDITDNLHLSYLVSEECLSLHRTNVRMSGNQKLVHKSDNEIYLESIGSSDYLNRSFFKGYKVDVNQGYLFNLKQFLAQSTKELSIYDVRNEETTISKEFSTQYPNLYKWGAYTEISDVIKDKNVVNSYRFFAPLWTYGKLPDRFLIFKVPNSEFTTLEDYFKNGELIHSVNLKDDSTFGAYLRTLTDNDSFKESCIYTNFTDSSIRYYGINYKTGKFVYHTEANLDTFLANERTITEFNNSLTNGWKRGNLICPNLLNLEFVFSDNNAPSGFNNYIGIYTYDNEINKYEANKLEKLKNTVILSEDDTKTIHFKTKNNKRTELQPYNKTIRVIDATQLDKTTLNPIAEITLPYFPIIGSNIIIKYNDEIELQIYIDSYIYNSDSTDEILQKIANIINETSTLNIIITASVVSGVLVIKSEIIDDEYENIEIVLPHVFEMVKPKYYKQIQPEETTFNMITLSDVFVNEVDWETADKIEVDGIEYELLKSFTYRGNNVLRLNDGFDKIYSIDSPTLKVKQKTYPKYFIQSIVKHVDFHTTMKQSPYYDIWDYNYYDYQYKFGLKLIPIFKKEIAGTLTNEEKEIILAYRSFFKFTDIEKIYEQTGTSVIPTHNEKLKNLQIKEVLIKSLDTISNIPNETIKNEFIRLSEETLTELRNANVLEPLLLKFVNTNGNDSYNNPISLNIDLSRRYDNFQYLNDEFARSNSNHTHQWFILGAGPGLYDKDSNKFMLYLDNIQKQLGYANIPIIDDYHHSITLNQYNDKFDICNSEIDVYNYLSYKLSKDKDNFYYKHGYIHMFEQHGTNNWNAIFRGVEYSITGNYKDYRFSVIMINELTSSIAKTITNPYTLVDNREFKTLTLIINFKIHDKYITSLNDKMPYFLDRSYLYFTDKFYNTTALNDLTTGEDFEIIELILFDNSKLHFYKDKLIEHTKRLDWDRETESSSLTQKVNSWYTLDENNNPIFSLQLGIDSQLAGHSFTDLIEVSTNPDMKTNFEWVTVSTLSDSSLVIMMRFTAYDIININETEIWCKDIFIEFIPTTIKLFQSDDYTGSFIELTLEDILLNNKPTITINGRDYDIPFWEKIKSSRFMKLPIFDSKGQRKGLRLTKEFYEEIDNTKFIYPDNLLNSQHIRQNSKGDKFICFDGVVHEKDTNTEKNNKLNLDKLHGYFMEQDQFWYISKDLVTKNSSFLNHTSKMVISSIEAYNIANANLVFDIYPIKTIITDKDNFFESTKKINILPISETYILLSLGYNEETNKLFHKPNLFSYGLKRQDGNYNPLFNCILQPYTFRESNYILEINHTDDLQTLENVKLGQLIWNKQLRELWECVGFTEEEYLPIYELSQYNDDIERFKTIEEMDTNLYYKYIGQMIYIEKTDELYIFYKSTNLSDLERISNYIREYDSCMLPVNLFPIYSGRRIATTDSTFTNYCEEFIDDGLRHINMHNFYKAIYDGREYDVISNASLTEQRNFISSIYNNFNEKNYTLKLSGDYINLIDLTINDLGKKFLAYLNEELIDYNEMLYALKLYNKDLNKDNIIFENFYYELYKHHYEEFLCKYYKVTEITTFKGQKVEFNYETFSKIKVNIKKLNSVDLNIKITKI